MRILVTGGAGFIGSHVVDAYIRAGHEVAVLDNFRTGKREQVNPAATIFEGDITNEAIVREVLTELQPDVINHHAAQISVTDSVQEPIFDAQQNVIGTLTLLNSLVAVVPKGKFIYASSGGAMYGKAEEIPYKETATPWASSPYGLSKYVAEQYIWLYAKLHGVSATVLRYSNVYGPRQDAHGEAGVNAIFADRMIAQQPITMYGEGLPTRDYVFVEDVAAANVATLTAGTGESFNISTGVATATQTVFNLFKEALHYSSEAAYAPLRPGEVVDSVLSPAKAKEGLGWEATTDYPAGVRQTAAWYLQSGQEGLHE